MHYLFWLQEMEKQLTIIQEKMSENDTNLQTVQREKQQLKEMAEQETQRYKEKLDKKQKNCDELLDQMHLWREQVIVMCITILIYLWYIKMNRHL